MLADLPTAEKPFLIGRSDELSTLSDATLDRFARVAVLEEAAESDDGEEIDEAGARGLHAKIVVAETGRDTAITVGSGNATRPAFLSGNNVELFATLTGKRSRIGRVDEIFGENGFGRLTRPFTRAELPPPDPAIVAAQDRLDEARRELCQSQFTLSCEGIPSEVPAMWRLRLTPIEPIPLTELGALRIWPITLGETNGRDALELLREGHAVDFGSMSLADLTRFLAFELNDLNSHLTLRFSTGFTLDGQPSDRHSAVLRSIINNKEAFFRYLRLLLAEHGDPFAFAIAAHNGSGHGRWDPLGHDAPLLEDMVRDFCRGGDQLRSIKRLIDRLSAGPPDSSDPIPPEFRSLWDAFRKALDIQERSHAD
jgi:hypothetical protein